MAEDVGYVAPINHSTSSAMGSTVGGAAGGALKGGAKGWLVGLMAPIALGAAVLGIPALIISSFVVSGAALGAVGTVALWTLGASVVGGVFGAFGSLPVASVGAALGGIFGGVTGASRASDKVAMERGAATQLQAQVEASKYQAIAMAQASNDNRYNFPAQGSRMNPAMAQFDAGSASLDGRLAGMNLQRA